MKTRKISIRNYSFWADCWNREREREQENNRTDIASDVEPVRKQAKVSNFGTDETQIDKLVDFGNKSYTSHLEF